MAVPSSLALNGHSVIPFDPTRDGTMGGTACVIMGYDDQLPLPAAIEFPLISQHSRVAGAFLVKMCWGDLWGDSGYGWLPYAFIESGWARDAWGVVHPGWKL